MSRRSQDGGTANWEEIFPACDAEALAEVIAVDSIDHSARPMSRRASRA